ncbi:hypothetical protein [Gracilibacillus massiliensis]|uniref:hypothetical protein n=1 Tax=Gracilibacillus massiliensis TaxID=1564956 RepID=UPI000B102D80|nr:hypothetical protein [Gracilibacillus massiliensis]
MHYYYNPEVKYLLMPKSLEKETLLYNANLSRLKVPTIGPRPPYFTNPIYQPYYPII